MAWPLALVVAGGLSAFRVPALAIFFGNIAATLFVWFMKVLTKKLAYQITVGTMVAGLTITLFLTIKATIAGITYFVPPEITQVANFIIPANFWPCVSSVFAAKIARWAYTWQVHAIEMAAGNAQ